MDSSSDSETLEMSFESSFNSDIENALFRCELTAENPVYTFTVDEEDAEVYKIQLELDVASIRHDVKDEYNVVEVTACDENGEEVTKTLAILRRSGDCIVPVEDIFDPPVTFRLRAGSGPVGIFGEIIKAERDEMYYKCNEE